MTGLRETNSQPHPHLNDVRFPGVMFLGMHKLAKRTVVRISQGASLWPAGDLEAL